MARDLRRKYGEGHRIVRAESGAVALDALRQMKLRGEPVAVLLADYRMPEMNGIEFLEQAMDIYPGARRALLTAYADTGAAIDAINVVDLDYYLLKPWDPPEEKLYPVVDSLLDIWRATDHRPVPELKVVGHRWSARSSEVREFRPATRCPTAGIPPTSRRASGCWTPPRPTGWLPVVITADGEALVEPSDSTWRPGSGWRPRRRPSSTISWSSAAARPVWVRPSTASEGLRTVLVSGPRPAGRRARARGSRTTSVSRTAYPVPSSPTGLPAGHEVRRRTATTREVTGLEVHGPARTVRFSDGSAIDAHAVILATGVAYRRLARPASAT